MMQTQCSFCRYCLDDSGSIKRKYTPTDDGKHAWECEDVTECRNRVAGYYHDLLHKTVGENKKSNT